VAGPITAIGLQARHSAEPAVSDFLEMVCVSVYASVGSVDFRSSRGIIIYGRWNIWVIVFVAS
jgi:hypothetical protein